MTNYKAKKSNLKALLSKKGMDLESLERNTSIPQTQLNDYLSKKVMNLNTAMTISRELNCSIEDLYIWSSEEKKA
ncbi:MULTISPECIES: helix-turn-helix transcriptional regulator [Neobacillus]|uniref:helix-turn-helix domain-containing protein n=1 Tax=Neobacillus TaxID=2675232 RepID=UPI000825E196|nr:MULTISPECIES: helix-turn-helix transcriptional regulator [Neobacillus]MDR7240227.1 DNA-binding Xre family transcriptional regulator [Neobacillus drentensis]NHC38874.1 helix-turn-helix transcriptional regulator [Bacillus sp. MM2020_1]PEQ93022.1 XRE family transcriptional regulator [Bacillus sp. AFS006103]WML26040.1 helix-turn-helix transcriptional regulator [Neobacillus sp. OS1-33]